MSNSLASSLSSYLAKKNETSLNNFSKFINEVEETFCAFCAATGSPHYFDFCSKNNGIYRGGFFFFR